MVNARKALGKGIPRAVKSGTRTLGPGILNLLQSLEVEAVTP